MLSITTKKPNNNVIMQEFFSLQWKGGGELQIAQAFLIFSQLN